jgi:DNA polymerase III alpha subunit
MFKNFVTPHCHPQSLDTASTLSEFAKREKELETGYMTCTDHGSLGACREVYKTAKDNGLSPILGIEHYLRDDEDQILKKFGIEKDKDNTFSQYNKYYHVTTHSIDQEAYEALVKITSKADLRGEQHGSERKPLLTWEDLEYLGSKNVTMMSSCLIGLVARHLTKNNRPDIAEAFYQKIRSIVKPGNFYVEMFPHICDRFWVNGISLELEDKTKENYWPGKKLNIEGIGEIKAEELAKIFKKEGKVGKLLSVKNNGRWDDLEGPKGVTSCNHIQDFTLNECMEWAPDSDYQLGANKFILGLAQKYGDKVMISDDSHYSHKNDKPVQDARLGSGGQAWKMYEHYHRMSSEETWEYFSKRMNISSKTFEGWIDTSHEWASRFKDFKFVDKKYLPASFYPEDTVSYLGTLINKHGRMDWNDDLSVNRLKQEIKLLRYNGTIDLLPYFFCQEEGLDRYTKKRLITGAGRGSAAGLLISYLLRITHINPLDWDLSLDRFLTMDRIASGRLPDIDSDLPDRTDDCEIIKWLEERFPNHWAQISTNSLLHLKSAMKDVARATMGYVPSDIEGISTSLPIPPQGVDDSNFIFGYTSDDGKVVKGLIDRNRNLQQYSKKYPNQWEIVQKSLRLVRGKSVHASAFVVSDRPISDFIPLQTITGVRATQYTMESVEEAGGIKIDYLGLNTLKDINGAVKLIAERHGKPDTATIEINGKKVMDYEVISFEGKFSSIYDLPEKIDVYNDICAGNTETVFQLDTDGARKWLKEFNYYLDRTKDIKCINNINDLASFTALDRSGPLDAFVEYEGREINMLQVYARKVRGVDVPGTLEILDQLVPETKGILCYQESLQKVYQQITGCTGAEANTFRENIAKKKTEKVNKSYKFYMERAVPKLGEQVSKQLWEVLNVWSGYGFNKCITGDTVLLRSGANENSGPEITVKELYVAQSAKTDWGKKIRAAKLQLLAMSADGRVRPQKMKKIVFNGNKKVIEIKTECGKTIKVTNTHRLLTDKGYIEAQEIKVGNGLVCMGVKDTYQKVSNQNFRGQGSTYVGRGFLEGCLNPAYLDGRTGFLNRAKQEVWARAKNKCELCGLRWDGKPHSMEFAHTKPLAELGGDYKKYHNANNARLLCGSCHRKFDHQKGERKPRWSKGVPTIVEKIVSIKKLEIEEDVFDIEMDSEEHNFIANGIVSHNSHSYSYAKTAYACAFLKYYYPLEWWCSVLNNADKNEISEKFWKFCKDFVVPPDINHSTDKFYIKGDKIIAPLSLIQGVGEKAHKELVSGLPYKDVEDFCKKIILTKESKTDEEKKRSALNIGIVSKLIISGVLDSLFPPNLDTISKLELYNKTFSVLKKEKQKKLGPIFEDWNKLKEYQTKKSIYPIYSQNLVPFINIEGLDKKINKDNVSYVFNPNLEMSQELCKYAGKDEIWWRGSLPVIDGSLLSFLNKNGSADNNNRLTVATVAYVMGSRVFDYQKKNGKSARAQALILDIDNQLFDFVKWGDWKTGKLSTPTDKPDCAIILAVVTKSSEDRPFAIDSFLILKEPLKEKK